MPAPIVLSTLTPETKRVPNPPQGQPVIATKAELRDGSRPTVAPQPTGLIFSEDFSNQTLWVALNPDGTRNDPPPNWDNFRSSEQLYAPSTGYPDKHETLEIVDNAGDVGNRAMRCWRESDDTQNQGLWNSDAILTKRLPNGGSNEVYVKFRFKLQPGWSLAGIGKLFRISHLKEGFPEYGFGNTASDGQGPIVFWNGNGGEGDFGFRNFFGLRGYPNATNYFFNEQAPTQLPRAMANGDISCNWGSNVTDLNGDGTIDNTPYPSVIDGTAVGSIATLAEIYGDGQWVTAEFYVKMNTAPGATDGILKQWINGHLCFSNEVMPWCGPSASAVVKWNTVSFGGNCFWPQYPAAQAVEEWYVIDDIEIHNSLPEGV